jgi:DedD protein
MTRLSLFAALLLAPALPLAAQGTAFPTSPELQAIIRLAQDGRSDSAQTLIKGVLATRDPARPDYAEALYTAATIASSGDEARLLFSRVAVEYSRSGWGDKALLRLAQLDYGAGDSQGTVSRVARLMTSYPQSSVFAEAALWGARAAIEAGDVAQACTWLDRGLEQVGTNVELQNQIEFTRRRCTPEARSASPATTTPLRTPERRPVDQPTVTTPPRDTAPAAPVTPTPTPTPPPPPAVERQPDPAPSAAADTWRVQVAAVSDPVAIARLQRAIRGLGLTAYTSRSPSGLTRVQAGPFATRQDAEAAVGKLRDAAGGEPFVTHTQP